LDPQFPRYRGWRVEKVPLAPWFRKMFAGGTAERGRLVQDLNDLIADL